MEAAAAEREALMHNVWATADRTVMNLVDKRGSQAAQVQAIEPESQERVSRPRKRQTS